MSPRFVTPRGTRLLAGLTLWLIASFRLLAVQVDVDANQVLRTVDDRMFGVNTAVWDSAFNNTETIPLLKALDLRTLRFPGGSTSDGYVWNQNRSYDTATGNLNTWTWSVNTDDFAKVVKAINANAFITVNYGSGTPQLAADWVNYCNVQKGYGFKYWEIGNENYGSWEYDKHAVKNDPVTYANEVADYVAKMKAVDPTIKIGVVVVDGEDQYAVASRTAVTNPRTGVSHKGWTPVMLARLKALGVTPDFAIFHRYPYGPGNESDANLLGGKSQSGTTWAQDAANLRQQLNDYLGPVEGPKVELTVTENNSVFSDTGKQTTSLVNGLFLADSFGSLLQTEFNSFLWWALRNGPQDKTNNNSTSLYGWRNYGDYGIIAPGNATDTPVSSPYPTYYVMKLLSRFARAGDQVVKVTSDSPLLAAYAVKRTDGTVALLVINKSPTQSASGHFTLHGFTPASRASVFTYGIAQDEAARTGTGLADITLSSLSGIGPEFDATFAAYSATVIQLYATGASSSRIANLSVRASAGSGAQTLIVGYVIGGAGTSGQLPVLARALGPTLITYGVAGALADPQLTLHTNIGVGGVPQDSVVATNDNWGGGASLKSVFLRLGAAALTDASLDAAIYLDLNAKPYTAHVTSTAGTGVAIAEVYDGADHPSASTPRLVNIAGRAQVGKGDDVLIAGFVISGSGPKTVLIRGLGPALTGRGVTGVLAQPRLELHGRRFEQDSTLAINTAWGGSNDLITLFNQVGAAADLANNSTDAALVVTLTPGVYSAVITGVNATTGVALVEVFEVE